LNTTERVQTRFCHFNVMPRDRHDDFADQTDDAGIGATRDPAAQRNRKAIQLHVLQAGPSCSGPEHVTR
jgi:hypothetical protein